MLPSGVLVYAVEGPFFFGAVETFERALASTHTDPKVLIIRLKWVPFMDITGLQTLEEVIADLHRRKVRVMITGARAQRKTAKGRRIRPDRIATTSARCRTRSRRSRYRLTPKGEGLPASVELRPVPAGAA